MEKNLKSLKQKSFLFLFLVIGFSCTPKKQEEKQQENIAYEEALFKINGRQ